jgi:hypothetical protein
MLKVNSRTTIEQVVNYAKEELGITLTTEGKDKKALIAEVRAIEKEQGIGDGSVGDDTDLDNDADQEQNGANSTTQKEPGTQSKEPAASQSQTKPATKSDVKKNPSRAVINIHQPAAPDEGVEPDSHCEVSLNGRVYQLQYGVDLEVDYGIYDILNNAVQTKYFQKKNMATGLTETHEKRVKRFPFNVVRFID